MSSDPEYYQESEKHLASVEKPEEKYDMLTELNLDIALTMYDKQEKFIEQLKTIRWYNKEKIDEFNRLIIFVDQALKSLKNEIVSLADYDIYHEDNSNRIVVSYVFNKNPSLNEEKKIARKEVLILEKINVYRINFERTYKL